MKVENTHYRTVWMEDKEVCMIDQNRLPFKFKVLRARTYYETCHAIRTMIVRGAGAIGATAGFAMAQACLSAGVDDYEDVLLEARKTIEGTRPTARDLFYATERVYTAGLKGAHYAVEEAAMIAEENVSAATRIGHFGNTLIKEDFRIMTHCNAGWLAFVDVGSALAPIYTAHHGGKNIFVYADETRPRSQGGRLTAWELYQEKVPFTVVPDNAGAFLMSRGKVDMVIVGADRIAANGDVANKIGTFEKAIVAKNFGVPFYVAAPLSTFDSKCATGQDIPIEERDEEEVLFQTGPDSVGVMHTINVCAPGATAINPAFDVTPAEYITGIITEKGIIKADVQAIHDILK